MTETKETQDPVVSKEQEKESLLDKIAPRAHERYRRAVAELSKHSQERDELLAKRDFRIIPKVISLFNLPDQAFERVFETRRQLSVSDQEEKQLSLIRDLNWLDHSIWDKKEVIETYQKIAQLPDLVSGLFCERNIARLSPYDTWKVIEKVQRGEIVIEQEEKGFWTVFPKKTNGDGNPVPFLFRYNVAAPIVDGAQYTLIEHSPASPTWAIIVKSSN